LNKLRFLPSFDPYKDTNRYKNEYDKEPDLSVVLLFADAMAFKIQPVAEVN